MKGARYILCLFLFLAVQIGCSAKKQPLNVQLQHCDSELSPAILSRADLSWHSIQFVMNWPERQERNQATVVEIADRILHPLLQEYGCEMPLWRVHRRAVRDKAGHRFTFYFFSPDTTAEKAAFMVTNSSVVSELLQRGEVLPPGARIGAGSALTDLRDLNAEHWSAPMQVAWPNYIMGASQAWVSMVASTRTGLTNGREVKASQAQQLYQQVERRVRAQWRDDAEHAFFHHLSAVFGYEPLLVDGEEVTF